MKRLLMATAIILASLAPAHAADLGGNCCSDLKERIAKLEGTAATKGNRKMSLTVYGQVHEGILWYDAEGEKDVVVSPGQENQSKIGLRGDARATKDISAGFKIEIDVLTQEGGLSGDPGLELRLAHWWLEHKSLGRVSVGRINEATDSITEISMANTGLAWAPLSTGYTQANISPWDGNQTNGVRYDTPTFAGFTFSASWSSEDTFDIAARYGTEIKSIRLGVGVGFKSDGIWGEETFSGSGSIMHTTTGLFLNGVYGQLKTTELFADDIKLTGYAGTAGIERRWMALGKTTLYGEYGKADVEDLDVSYYGLGIVQAIDLAAMDIYIAGRQFEFADDENDVDGTAVMAGARVRF